MSRFARNAVRGASAVVLALPFAATTQVATLTKNDFTGTVGFNLITPGSAADVILTSDFGMNSATVTATGIGNSLSLSANNSTPGSPKVSPTVGRPYTVSAEAANGGAGFATYNLRANANFGMIGPGFFFNRFDFNGPAPPSNTFIVTQLPAPATVVNFQECVGIVELKLGSNGCTAPTVPVLLRDPYILSTGSQTSTSGLASLLRHISKPTAGLQNFILHYSTGTDAFHDLIQNEITFQAAVNCGAVTPVCLASSQLPGTSPCIGANCPPSGLGEIIGQWDVVGELENANNQRTFMTAFNGPFNNFRWDNIGGEPGSPNAPIFPGPPRAFDLENLVAGDYLVFGQTTARLGRQYVFIQTELVSAKSVANQTTDLGNTFVMTPAFFYGDILLVHFPPSGKPTSGLYDLYFSDASAINNVPTSLDLGTGSRLSLSSNGSTSITAWPYNPNPSTGAGDNSFGQSKVGQFRSNYNLPVVRAKDVTGNWPDSGRARFELRFDANGTVDGTAPLPRPNGNVVINEAAPAQPLSPKQTRQLDFKYCFATVHVHYVTTTGTLYDPRATLSGSFSGTLTATDKNQATLFSRSANYTVDANFIGIPQNFANRASTGDLVITVPKGGYTLTPTVNVDNGSTTTFRSITFDPPLECDEHRDVTVGTPVACDVDGDGDVDRLDIAAIFSNRGKKASGAGDPMDVNSDGVISVNDSRICALRCTRPNCNP